MSSGIIPKSKLYANKDNYTTKEEGYHSERVEKEAAVKNWEYLASELERDAEEVVINRAWTWEDGGDDFLDDIVTEED